MRNMFQCEKCGKVFADYDECAIHEQNHWDVCEWWKEFEKASAEFIQYSEGEEAPSVVGVELMRWDAEKGGTVHAVATYQLKRIYRSDKLVSDEVRKRLEEEKQEAEATENV